MKQEATAMELGCAFYLALLKTDPDEHRHTRAGAAILAVLDDLSIKDRNANGDLTERRLTWKDKT